MTFKLKARRLWIVNFSIVKVLASATAIPIFGLLGFVWGSIDVTDPWWLIGGLVVSSCWAFDIVSFQRGTSVVFRQYVGPLFFAGRKKVVVDDLKLEAHHYDDDDDERHWYSFINGSSVSVGGKLSGHRFSCSDPHDVIEWIEAALLPRARIVRDGRL